MPGKYALEGRTLGRYRLLKGIGQGGMAEVYLAEDERLERQVAIKILPAALAREGNFLARFEREARSAARLHHPNILQIHDFGQQDGITYLVMPYLPGGTLAQRIAQARGPLPLDKVVLWTSEMASALQFAHSQGIIHRDVKPGNMLMADGDHIVLSDFGIAKVVNDSTNLTMAGSTVGSPDYMAPEQANGEPDYRSDIYSLGVVVFQMLTGRVPFTASTPVQVMLMHVQATPPTPRSFNPALPPQVDAVIKRAMAKRPAERYQSANELAASFRLPRRPCQAIPSRHLRFPPSAPRHRSRQPRSVCPAAPMGQRPPSHSPSSGTRPRPGPRARHTPAAIHSIRPLLRRSRWPLPRRSAAPGAACGY